MNNFKAFLDKTGEVGFVDQIQVAFVEDAAGRGFFRLFEYERVGQPAIVHCFASLHDNQEVSKVSKIVSKSRLI